MTTKVYNNEIQNAYDFKTQDERSILVFDCFHDNNRTTLNSVNY